MATSASDAAQRTSRSCARGWHARARADPAIGVMSGCGQAPKAPARESPSPLPHWTPRTDAGDGGAASIDGGAVMDMWAEPRVGSRHQRVREVGQDGEPWLRPIFRIGGWAAVAAIVLVVANGALLIFFPIPSTVLGHFQQIQDNGLIGLVNLDLVMLASEVLLTAVYVALYAALRRENRMAVTLAIGIALGGVLLYVAVNPALSFLYL